VAPGGRAATGGRNAGGVPATGGRSASGAPSNGGDAGDGGLGGAGNGEGGANAAGNGAAGKGNEGGKPGVGAGGGGTGSGVDPFGITQLYPTANPAGVWTSEHWSGSAYEIDSRIDDNDPLEISGMRGEGSLEVTGTGELIMSGSQPRIYVYPGTNGPWKNVEVTVYYQRVEDEDTAYAGLVVGTRSGAEGHTDSTACEAHTYYARLRNDGAIDFEKELEHPASSTQSRVDPDTVWPGTGDVPFDSWIGWKFVIYNLPSGDAVKLEAYRDLTNGEEGGDWIKMNETVDDGGWSVETSCDEYSPSGGESDAVVLDGGVTFIRNTDVTEARYRWVSVREIIAP
jgi:hypothetical protein